MKTPHLMPLMLAMMLLTTSVMAQKLAQSSDPLDVIVLEKSWYREVQHPGRDPNPLQPNEEQERLARAQKAVIRRNAESLPNQPTEERMPIVIGPPLPAKMARSITYVYKITVKNTGAKTTKAIYWEYEFLDPDSQEVMGHRRIASKAKISPGQSRELERRFYTQPTRLVASDKLDRKYRDQFTERVIIHRIQYTDGSAWQRAQ